MVSAKRPIFSILLILGLIFSPFSFNARLFSFNSNRAEADDVSTTVHITVCGNGLVEEGELCDDGADNGRYSSSGSGRYCNTTCDGWGPYCGDGIYHQEYGEECDDGNNESNDGCTAACEIEEGGGTTGGGGPFPGGSFTPPLTTGVVIKGKAYPNADVQLLREGEVIGLTKANALADFAFTLSDVNPGVTTFGFWAEDIHGIKSIFVTVTFQVVPDAITNVSGVFLPPTIQTDEPSVGKGEEIVISGQTIPETRVYIYISSTQIIKEAESAINGVWELTLDTTPLEENSFHTAKAMFKSTLGGLAAESGFSKFVSFYVGEGAPAGTLCAGADLNGDGRVNLGDFSILLYHWGTGNVCADQNQDGTVNLADFSIMMYYWTG